MAVLPFRPTPFFANKNQAFWRLQALGWGGAMLLRAVSSLANDQPLSFLVLVFIATITGFSISLILAVLYRYLITKRPLVTWGFTTLVAPFAVGLYAFIDTFGIIHATTGGGPGQATSTLVFRVYRDGFEGLDLGISAAQSVILLLVIGTLTPSMSGASTIRRLNRTLRFGSMSRRRREVGRGR